MDINYKWLLRSFKRAQSHRKLNSLVHTFITNITIEETPVLQIISHIFGNFGVKFLYRLFKYNTKRTHYHVKHHIHLYQLSVTCMDKVHSGLERPERTFIVLRCIFWCLLEIIPVEFRLYTAIICPIFQHCNVNWTQMRLTEYFNMSVISGTLQVKNGEKNRGKKTFHKDRVTKTGTWKQGYAALYKARRGKMIQCQKIKRFVWIKPAVPLDRFCHH